MGHALLRQGAGGTGPGCGRHGAHGLTLHHLFRRPGGETTAGGGNLPGKGDQDAGKDTESLIVIDLEEVETVRGRRGAGAGADTRRQRRGDVMDLPLALTDKFECPNH